MTSVRALRGSAWRANAALAALSLGTFCFVTIEILPVGLLTVIADDLDRSRSSIGLLVTGYAVVVVLLSVPVTGLTHRLPRRRLLAAAFAVFVLSTLVSATAVSYSMLLAGRLLTALTHALFWSLVVRTAAGLFPPAAQGRTIARLAIGTALAPVVGVPAGTWLGQQAGWRVAFLAVAGIGLVTCLAVLLLPPSAATTEQMAGPAPEADRRRYGILVAATATGVAGAMIVFTYITPFLLDVSGFAPAALGPLLLVTGVAGVAGTLSVGRVLDRYPRHALLVPLALLATTTGGLYILGSLRPATIAMLVLLGLGFNALSAAIQNRTLQVAPGNVDIAAAAVSAAFNAGTATGSLVGSVLIAVSGPRSVTLVGCLLLGAALVLMLTERAAVPGRPPGAPEPLALAATGPDASGQPSTSGNMPILAR